MLCLLVAQGIMFGQQAPGVPNLASIVVPLSAEINITVSNPKHAVMHHPQTTLRAA